MTNKKIKRTNTANMKSRLANYAKGGRIPKYQYGTSGTVSLGNMQRRDAEYMSPLTAQQPQINYGGYNSFEGYQDANYDLPASLEGSYTQYQPQQSTSNINNYLGYGTAAASAISGLSDGEWNTNEVQSTVDVLGSTIGGPFYSAGKTVDQALFAKDPQSGAYDSQLEAQLSFGLTDPAQSASQFTETWQGGDEWGAVAEALLPGLAGMNYQNEAEAEEARLAREQSKTEFKQSRQAYADMNLGVNSNPTLTYAKGGITHTMPDGTVMPGAYHGDSNAELETKEVFRTPDGSIEKVPEGTPSHANGGVKMALPEGTEILGKMKGNYNNRSYKDIGQDLKKRYDKYNKAIENSTSTLSKRTAERMLDKVNIEFDNLMTEQEVQKMVNKFTGYTDKQVQESLAKFSPDRLESDLEGDLSIPANIDQEMQFAKGGQIPQYGGGTGYTTNNTKGYYDLINRAMPNSVDTQKRATENIFGDSWNKYNNTNQGWWEDNQRGVGTALGAAAQLAPAAYNIGMGLFGAESTLDASDFRNPYAGQIRRDLGDINYNIRPELEANELAYQTARRNIRQVAPGTGALMSQYGALAGGRMRADASAYARKQNIEGQFRGQRAGIYGQLGAQEAKTKLGVAQYNKQVEAAKQSALSTGITQLGGVAGQMFTSRSQREQDIAKQKALQAYVTKYNVDPKDAEFMNLIYGG